MRDVTHAFLQPDSRSRIVLEDVSGATLENIRAPRASSEPALVLRRVRDIEMHRSLKLPDQRWDNVDETTL
jgi:hypothetical protein